VKRREFITVVGGAAMWVNPVVLPPGRARLLTSPLPTGSVTVVNTIGVVRGVLLLNPGYLREPHGRWKH
jgi:hypothetical protein